MARRSRANAVLRFADIATVNPRCAPNGLTGDDLVSFIPMADVDDSGRWVVRQTRPLREVRAGYSPFGEGDVLFAKITPCTENGKGCHATDLVNGFGFGSTEFHVLRAKDGVLRRLVYHLAQAPDVRWRAAAIMDGSAGQQRVPADFFRLCRVASDILDGQDVKCRLFDALDDAIDATRRVIEQTRRLKSAVLHDLLTLGLPGRHSEFRKLRFLGHIPTSWAIADFDEVSTVVRGSSPRPAGDPRYFNGSHMPWITVQEVTRDSSVYLTRTSTDLTEAGMRRSRILEPGTLVLTNSGATLGVPKILKIRGCVNDGIAAFLSLDARVNPLFAFYYLQRLTPIFRDVIAPGLGQPNLNTDLIGQTMIPVPDEQEQAVIARTVFAVDQRIEDEIAKVEQLHRLKTALSQALLTGRVRMPASSISSNRAENTAGVSHG